MANRDIKAQRWTQRSDVFQFAGRLIRPHENDNCCVKGATQADNTNMQRIILSINIGVVLYRWAWMVGITDFTVYPGWRSGVAHSSSRPRRLLYRLCLLSTFCRNIMRLKSGVKLKWAILLFCSLPFSVSVHAMGAHHVVGNSRLFVYMWRIPVTMKARKDPGSTP